MASEMAAERNRLCTCATEVAEAIGAVNAALQEHFPLVEGERNPNELPDAPVVV